MTSNRRNNRNHPANHHTPPIYSSARLDPVRTGDLYLGGTGWWPYVVVPRGMSVRQARGGQQSPAAVEVWWPQVVVVSGSLATSPTDVPGQRGWVLAGPAVCLADFAAETATLRGRVPSVALAGGLQPLPG